jgi:hypothetical protein
MHPFKFQQVSEEPRQDDVLLYPDYLVSCLLREGIGRIEADRALQERDNIEFVLTPKFGAVPRAVGHLNSAYFRSVLAHFGGRCSEDMLYGGHKLFCCDFEREGRMRTHRFSLFLCNEPAMGCWMKLYLYCVDGVWPMRKEAD